MSDVFCPLFFFFSEKLSMAKLSNWSLVFQSKGQLEFIFEQAQKIIIG
jgi:hypothetical protein